jgi:hypothetical protein
LAVFALAAAEEGFFEAYTKTPIPISITTGRGFESFRDRDMRLLR